jgi:hypothetical protein
MSNILNSDEQDLSDALAYAGLVLLAFELLKSMIVKPIKVFYAHTTFSGGPFVSYEHDVMSRHKSEFEACLLYLRDFMEAIDRSVSMTLRHQGSLIYCAGLSVLG